MDSNPELGEQRVLADKIKSLAVRLFRRSDLFRKRVRNRIPDGVLEFSKKYIAPYSAVILIAIFSFGGDFAKALAANSSYVPSADVMDLAPADVAAIASDTAAYTPNVEVDPVTVALAMDNSAFLGSPMIATTQITNEPAPAPTSSAPKKRSTTITYTVDPGDTISSIGWQYGLKISTIKTLNSLRSDSIRVGQQIKLPPQDLDPAALAKLQVKKVAGATAVNRPPGSKSNAYPYGWCTYYVATRRYVPGHWGNARSWLSSARSAGYPTGREPAVGAIVVTSESWMGHVAYVESVRGDAVYIAEMNYVGWGIASHRTISAHAGMVMGYIY